MSIDPGARLTRAEHFLVKTVNLIGAVKDRWEEVSDAWTARMVSEEMTEREYQRLLRDQKRGDGDIGRAWRSLQRARRWGRVAHFTHQRYKREYHDARSFGTGG